MAKGDDIQDRLIDFAVEVIEITSKLPKNPAGRHIAGQLLRSGTSPAPNYAEARAAESTRDFVHKLKIALKELNESKVWLEMAKRSKLLTEPDLAPLFKEGGELCNIIAASIVTALKRKKTNY